MVTAKYRSLCKTWIFFFFSGKKSIYAESLHIDFNDDREGIVEQLQIDDTNPNTYLVGSTVQIFETISFQTRLPNGLFDF